MERSKIAPHKWMMGFYLMNASKKGVSAHQLHRALGITIKSKGLTRQQPDFKLFPFSLGFAFNCFGFVRAGAR
jgi:hypothetical protein